MSASLTLLLDLDSLVSGLATQSARKSSMIGSETESLSSILNSITQFCASYSVMGRGNELMILAFHSHGVDFVWPKQSSNHPRIIAQTSSEYVPIDEVVTEKQKQALTQDETTSSIQSNTKFTTVGTPEDVDGLLPKGIPSLSDLRATLWDGLRNSFENMKRCSIEENQLKEEQDSKKNDLPKSKLASALSTALTYLHRRQLAQRSLPLPTQSRVLILQFDKDVAQDYNSIMNSIFSAQKLGVVIDTLVLSTFESQLMQQACFLTGGIYLKHGDWADLLLVLQSHFLVDNVTRPYIALPTQSTVDFKASCVCHRQPVEFAYMCSVCLALLCAPPDDACPVCDTKLRSKVKRSRTEETTASTSG